MSNILNKIILFLLALLFVFLPLINSHLLDLFWVDFDIFVSWNYEFSKVIFFNIISWIIIPLFFLSKLIKQSNKNKISIVFKYFIWFFILVLAMSTIFSSSPYISFFWNDSKAHSFIMFLNLIWFFIVLYNQKKEKLKKLVSYTIISYIIVSAIWLWQYFLPSYNYGELSNRLISTFWHPNYLALFYLMLTPVIIRKIEKSKIYFLVFILLAISIFFTKSALGILLFLFYLIFKFLYKKNRKNIFILTSAFSLLFLIIFILSFWLETKISSFISRIFIWETTLRIIFSDIKIILFWWWTETLGFHFDNFKSVYLYIFENIWYKADRSHNLFLDFFYSFWIWWFLVLFFIFSFISKRFFKNLWNKNNYYLESLILFFVFCLFNFPSIVHYTIFVLFLVIILKDGDKKEKKSIKSLSFFIIILLVINSIIWVYFSSKFYLAEMYFTKKEYEKSKETFPYYPKYFYKTRDLEKWLLLDWSRENYILQNIYSLNDTKENCYKLVKELPYSENYLYCYEVLNKLWEKEAIEFAKKWLLKLPDLRNNDSNYYNNFFVKNFINWNRFFSPKYSNLKEILEDLSSH